MKPAILLLAFVAISGAIAEPERLPLNSDTISDVFRQFSTQLTEVLGTQHFGRGLLTTKHSGDATDDHLHGFLHNVLGRNWSHWTPHSWSDPKFDWPKLGGFELGQHVHDFLNISGLNLTDANITDIVGLVQNITDAICTPSSFTPIIKVPPFCEGPSVVLSYTPKSCILDDIKKQIICAPATLTLVKKPGECVHHLKTPAVWKDKSCKLEKQVGVNVEVIIGGAEYQIPVWSPLLHHNTSTVVPVPPTPAPPTG